MMNGSSTLITEEDRTVIPRSDVLLKYFAFLKHCSFHHRTLRNYYHLRLEAKRKALEALSTVLELSP